MKKSYQFNIAVLCLFVFSNNLFASGLGPVRPIPGLLQEKNPTFTNPSGIGTKPTPIKPRPFFEQDKKLPGTFANPATELAKGNVSKAKLSCIQEAIDGGDQIPVDDSTVFDFSTSSSVNIPFPTPDVATGKLTSKLFANSQAPAAFAKGASCQGDLRHDACVELLSKSTSEIPQAYHNSSLMTDDSDWKEVLNVLGLTPFADSNEENQDVVTALKRLDEKNQKETGSKTILDLSSIENEDPLLLATNLLIQRIDEQLARGNQEGVEKAKAILTKINPSAAYAVSCVLSSVTQGGLNQDLDPSGRPKGSFFGPLSGVDYSKQSELKTHGMTTPAIAILVTIVFGTMTLITTWVNSTRDSDSKKAESDRNQRNLEIKEFQSCSGSYCEKLYPEGAKAVKESKESARKEAEKAAGTAGPARTVETDPGDIFAPLVPSKPRTGSGGSGGEMVREPIDRTPSLLETLTGKSHDFDKTVDPAASERFCQKTVRDYKTFVTKKITGSGRPTESLPIAGARPIPTGAFGVADFETWTPEYWAEQKRNRASDPKYQDKQNNCHAMDEAQGL